VEPDVQGHQRTNGQGHRRVSWTRGHPVPRPSRRPAALARAFLLLEARCDSLTTRSTRYRRKRRYEALCLATAIRRVQHGWLLSTADSEWRAPGLKVSLLAATKRELASQTSELARSRKWLSRHARRKAEARAKGRFEAIAAQIDTQVRPGLIRADEMSFPELAPSGRPRRLELARKRPQTARRAAAFAGVAFVALGMLAAVIAVPHDGTSGGEGAPRAAGSGAEMNLGTVPAAPMPDATVLEAVGAVDGPEAHGFDATGPDTLGGIQTLVSLTAWNAPAVAPDRDCSDFKNQRRSQRWFNRHQPDHDPSGLDRDHDGEACEGRPCPCSQDRPRRDRRNPAGVREQPPGDIAAATAPSGSTAAGATGTGPASAGAPTPPAGTSAPGSTPIASLTQQVRNVDQAAARAGVQTGLSQATAGVTSTLDRSVGAHGGVTGGLPGN
jgi:hypothetical protein